ncbi:MAG TPA: SAS053 family protein [Staphylococcus sp.]|nr:SAS053 family protein [Staphylococcus sp.]
MTDEIENKNTENDVSDTENEMVSDYEDVVELGKEMEQISEENDEDKLNKSHDSEIRSDLND